MTDEEIKQNAEVYADGKAKRVANFQRNPTIEDFIAGAHSRDEEIEQWKESKRKLRLRLMRRIHELSNPWISVEDRLPEARENSLQSADCTLMVFEHSMKSNCSHRVRLTGSYDHEIKDWYINTLGYCKLMPFIEVTHWMPIPELPKEGAA